MLTNADIAELTDWRRELHRFPEGAGEERETAARVTADLAGTRPDQVVTGPGGHGIAAIRTGAAPGETVLFRAGFDALPTGDDRYSGLTSIYPLQNTPRGASCIGKGPPAGVFGKG